MKISNFKISFLYFFSYLTLLLGLWLNEDFALGYIKDYELHLKTSQIFNNGIIYGLLNYEEMRMPHSPIYLYYFTFLQSLFNNELIAKIINIHVSLLLPFFVYKSLSIKKEFSNNEYIFLLPLIFFISPYFRSGAIWIDDSLIGLIFFSISVYYFIRYTNNEKLNYLFLNTLFLSFAAYIRPIYCLFSLYFFFQYFFILNSKNKFFYYIAFNLLLSFPAIYYVFILEINDWFENYLFRGNFITVISLATSVIAFYLIPYILFYIKNNKFFQFKLYEIVFLIIFILGLYFFFDYDLSYSGGIYYKLSKIIFSNNYLFFFAASVSFLYLIKIFLVNDKKKQNLSDFIILLILIFFELDGIIYHETYDPLIYILIFLIFNNKYIKNFIQSLNQKRFLFIFSFSVSFYLMSVIKILV